MSAKVKVERRWIVLSPKNRLVVAEIYRTKKAAKDTLRWWNECDSAGGFSVVQATITYEVKP